jgi:hypothetical protein
VDNKGHTLLTPVTDDFYVVADSKPEKLFKLLNATIEECLFALLEGGVDLQEYGA